MTNKPKVIILSAVTGNPVLYDMVRTVQDQTFRDFEHWIIVDGAEREQKVKDVLTKYENIHGPIKQTKVLTTPYVTGYNQYNGHRIYAAFTYLVECEYLTYLDEDNMLKKRHIQSMVELAEKKDLHWVYSLREIFEQDGTYICRDDCESLGYWNSHISDNDHLVDGNSFLLKRELAIGLAPIWYRRAKQPGVPSADRTITATLLGSPQYKFGCTGEYTLQYRAGSRADSVQGEFFKAGNKIMDQRYPNGFPWRRKEKK